MSNIGAPRRIIRVEPESIPVKIPQPIKEPELVKVPEKVGA